MSRGRGRRMNAGCNKLDLQRRKKKMKKKTEG